MGDTSYHVRVEALEEHLKRAKARRIAWAGLLMSAEGNLRGEDWDKEMRQAVGVIHEARE